VQSFADTFEQPIKLSLNGRGEVTVPLLSVRDYLPWLDELTQAQQARERDLVPPNTKPAERIRILRNVGVQEATPDDIAPLIFTGRGMIRVLEMALRKVGLTDEEIAKFIDSQSLKDNEKLAVRLSGIYSQRRIAIMYTTPEEAAALAEAEKGQQQTTFGNATDPPAAAQPAQS
jgi:hypothetical protein